MEFLGFVYLVCQAYPGIPLVIVGLVLLAGCIQLADYVGSIN